MKLLVTGGAGFIGSNYVRYVLDEHSDVDVVNLDALTYAGNLENLAGLEDVPRYTFVKGDITSVDDVSAVFEQHEFDAVVNFAAESHVDRSLHVGVAEFIRTNIQGVQNLLERSMEKGVGRFLQISTDEVYGSLGEAGKFTETSPIQPNNPYAASKAAADFFVRAAHKSHGLDIAITRCSNNFGPYQFPEKLIPLVVANALEDKDLPVYGDGMQVRDWIYVLDHCSAIDTVLRKAGPGSIYNVGGDQEVPNIEMVKMILGILGKPETLIKHVQDRPGHDRRYAMDAGKLRSELGWEPAHSFADALKETVDWYLANGEWLARVRSGEYQKYYEEMYGGREEVSSGR